MSARSRLQAFCQKTALPIFDSLKTPWNAARSTAFSIADHPVASVGSVGTGIATSKVEMGWYSVSAAGEYLMRT